MSQQAQADRPVKIYDVVNKKLLFETETLKEAVRITGVDQRTVRRAIKNKYKCHKNKLNIIICFR